MTGDVTNIRNYLPMQVGDMTLGQPVEFRVDGGEGTIGVINGFTLDGPIFLGDDGDEMVLPEDGIEDGTIEVRPRRDG